MNNLPLIWIACKRGKEKDQFCTACYAGWGIIYDGDKVKISKCLFCN
jgi:hypothetical protein